MTFMQKLATLAIIAGWMCLSSQSLAEGLVPPWRGDDGSTFASWDFPTNDSTPAPDVEDNPYGPAQMEVWTGIGQEYWTTWGGRDGVWPLSGTIEVEIPNNDAPNPYKDIWVQLVWAPQAPGTFPIVSEVDSGEVGTLFSEIQLEPTGEDPPAGDFWYQTSYLIHLEPNPSSEIIKIDGAVMIDQVIIDTICVPEPVSLWSLLGAMIITVGWWRWKRTP